jgi:hypothetical protein
VNRAPASFASSSSVSRDPARGLSRSARAALVVAVLAAVPTRADAPVSLGAAGALERAGLTHDARRNPTGASFGAPTSDDRRLFTLRWRLPWVMASGSGVAPFAGGFASTGLGAGGLSLAAEPTQQLSALVPQLALGEEHKVAHAQLGALSLSLGHRTLVDRFTNSPDGLARRAGALGAFNLAGLGAVLAVGDVFDPAAFLATRLHGRPIMWFLAPDASLQPNELDLDPRTELLGIWVVGASFAADLAAPAEGGATGQAVAFGVDNEAALLDNQLVKTIAFLDVNGLSTCHGGDGSFGVGVHPGAQLMFDALGARVDVEASAHAGSDGYQPRMFDRLYALERQRAFGATKPKLLLDRPASWGWDVRAQAGLFEAVTTFIEVRDQAPFDPTRGGRNLTATVGASTWLVLAGASVTATQTDLTRQAVFGPGFVVTAEGRVALLLNVLHLVGRGWRAHVPAGVAPGDYVVDEGVTVGVELNLDLL